jgi:hypothetical protein
MLQKQVYHRTENTVLTCLLLQLASFIEKLFCFFCLYKRVKLSPYCSYKNYHNIYTML